MAPIDLKLGESAIQAIPGISLFDVKDRKIFGFFGLNYFVLAGTHVSWATTHVSWPKTNVSWAKTHVSWPKTHVSWAKTHVSWPRKHFSGIFLEPKITLWV